MQQLWVHVLVGGLLTLQKKLRAVESEQAQFKFVSIFKTYAFFIEPTNVLMIFHLNLEVIQCAIIEFYECAPGFSVCSKNVDVYYISE